MSALFLRRQRGAALILLLAVLVIGASWFLVRRLDAVAGDFTAANRAYNAAVLNRAKQAVIGYVAAQAAKQFEDNPGALPCPEAPASFNSGIGNDGKMASSCTLPVVGRFPWRTIGTDKLIDAAGEPLWYVVSPGWAYNGSNTTINSNSVGQLTVDGVTGTDNDTVVALLIAPGPPISVAAAGGCTAWTQTRPTSGTPDWRNYLECENATSPADSVFVTTGPSGSFNDQVVRITKADIMPGIEAAIAHRVEREIVPQLKGVYASSAWGLSSTNPLYPYPAPFSSPNPGTSNYQGATGTYAGLLPFNYSVSCNPATDPRCTTSFVNWNTLAMPTVAQTGGAGVVGPYLCTITAVTAQCIGTYVGAVQLRMTAAANNVAMALKQVASSGTTVEYGLLFLGPPSPGTASAAFNSDGSANVYTDASLPLLDPILSVQFRMTANIAVLADHALLDSSNPTTGWFVRNEWYRLTYYAVAQGHTASALPAMPSCATSTNCLTVVNVTPTGAQRAILILAGRSINGSTRPSGTLIDYLEFGNATSVFERQPVSTAVAAALKKPFNDRIVVIDTN